MKIDPTPNSPPPKAELIETARKLEAVFVRQMFEEMAKTVESSELFEDSPGGDMYEQWFRGEVADRFAEAGGTGLGDQIASALGAEDRVSRSEVARMGHASAFDASLGLGRGLVARPSGHDHDHDQRSEGLTSGFGKRIHPVTGRPHVHLGIDLRAARGTGVRTAFAGVVQRVGENETLGRFVWVEHANGFRSLFGHLDEITVSKGQRLPSGGAVGRSGATGRVTGPHLHFGLFQGRDAVDPLRFIPDPGKDLLSPTRHSPKK
ncbi:MAG: peptidoglycan DD-metalloendopeptidase family protein [Myxococcota bacterium]